MDVMLYAAVKFIGYSLWGYVGFRLQGSENLVARSLRFGTARWFLGLGIGVLVFLVSGSINQEQVLVHYLAIYIPIRILEWAVMATFFFAAWKRKTGSAKFYVWLLGGVVLSFLTDFVSPDMLNGRFCVGRCLC